MKEIVNLLANRPINNIINTKATADNKLMNKSTDQSRNLEIGNVGGDFNASGTPNSKNSKLQTPNSKLQTPNSKLP